MYGNERTYSGENDVDQSAFRLNIKSIETIYNFGISEICFKFIRTDIMRCVNKLLNELTIYVLYVFLHIKMTQIVRND